jgi:RNaseH domain of pPIWI_RE
MGARDRATPVRRQGPARRLGSDISRWHANPQQQQANWYAHTSTEILVIGTTDDSLTYAIAAARLCDHTVAWDSRTRYPVPLHGAHQMDKDHPEYRRTIDYDERLDDGDIHDTPAEAEEA